MVSKPTLIDQLPLTTVTALTPEIENDNRYEPIKRKTKLVTTLDLLRPYVILYHFKFQGRGSRFPFLSTPLALGPSGYGICPIQETRA